MPLEDPSDGPRTPSARPAQPGDVAGMQSVRGAVRENRLVSTVIAEDDYLAHMREPSGDRACSWVVEVKGEVVAFAAVDAREGNVWALFVHPEHEGRGMGRELHDVMIAWAWSRGAARLWLTTAPRTRAQKFYERAGWSLVGEKGNELLYELHRPRELESGARRS
jgi:GNAT superfamily N-acetyltransferase